MKILKAIRLIILVFVLFSVWGWFVLRGKEEKSKLEFVGKAALWSAELPELIKKVIGSNFGTKNPLFLENKFPNVDDFDEMEFNLNGYHILLSSHSEIHDQTTTRLIDLKSKNVIREWIVDYQDVYNRLDSTGTAVLKLLNHIEAGKIDKYRARPKHALLLEDQSIVFNMSHGPAIRLDSSSNIQWMLNGHYHHSVELDHEGNLWIPYADYEGKFYKDLGMRDDAICKISPEGEILFKKSIIEILIENGYRGHVFGDLIKEDAIHLNDIQPVHTDSKYWKKGDVFISVRSGSIAILYRPETNEVIWLKRGPWLLQHDIDVLDSTRISIFGNNTIKKHAANLAMPHFYLNTTNDLYVYDFETDQVNNPYKSVFGSMNIATPTQGMLDHQNDFIYVEETDNGRHLFLDSASCKFQFIELIDDGKVSFPSWSRILVLDSLGNFVE